MEEIGKILPSLLRRHVRRADPPLVEILSPLWPVAAGKAIAEHSRPVAFGSGILTLAVSSSSWATQLQKLAEEIRAEVNSFLGSPVIKKLRVRLVGNLESEDTERVQPAFSRRSPAAPIELTDAEAELGPEISKIFGRSLAKYFARRPVGSTDGLD